MEKIGEFENQSGVMVISDPCYEDSNGCNTRVDMLPGKYSAYVERSDEGSSDSRIARLVVAHESVAEGVLMGLGNWRGRGEELGVDSGQMSMFDEDQYRNDRSVEGVERVHDEVICEDEPWYSMCCDRSLSKASAGVLPGGCVSSSGFGDGCYPLDVLEAAGMVVGLSVTFIDDEQQDN